jgi:hypothetical protein
MQGYVTARSALLSLVLLLVTMCAFASPSPQTVTLIQGNAGYNGSTDTYLSESNTDYNYGDVDNVRVWHDAVHYQDGAASVGRLRQAG